MILFIVVIINSIVFYFFKKDMKELVARRVDHVVCHWKLSINTLFLNKVANATINCSAPTIGLQYFIDFDHSQRDLSCNNLCYNVIFFVQRSKKPYL